MFAKVTEKNDAAVQPFSEGAFIKQRILKVNSCTLECLLVITFDRILLSKLDIKLLLKPILIECRGNYVI